MKKIILFILKSIGILGASLCLVVFVANYRSNISIVKPTLSNTNFKGTLLAVSDADQIGTAYADGIVNKTMSIEDSLAIIRFSGENQFTQHNIAASNSVVSWPSVLAHSKDGNFAYVAETRTPFSQNTGKVTNVWDALPKGTIMAVIDIQSNKKVQEVPLGKGLTSATVNHDGTLLATASTDNGKEEIVVTTLKNGMIDKVFRQEISNTRHDMGNDSGIKTVEFSPTENILAVNLHTEDVAFYRISGDTSSISIEQIGNVVSKVAMCWSVGNWTPNGKYFIVTDVAWGDGVTGATLNKEGSLTSIKFDQNGQHQVVSTAKVGMSPEGFDISPDGNWAIVANMRRTYLPGNLPFSIFPARNQASLSLVKVNQDTGELQTIGDEYGFEGELPEDAIFDAESKTIAVAIYNTRYEKNPKNGFIEFWQLDNEKLVKSNLRIPVTRGVHNLKLVK